MDSPLLSQDPFADLAEQLAAGRFREVLDSYRHAAPGVLRHRSDVLLTVATAATRMGDFGQAKIVLGEALDGLRARGDLDGQMRGLNLAGAIAFEQGDLGTAEVSFRETLKLARKLDDNLFAARAWNNLASVTHLQGKVQEALGWYRGALLSYQRIGDRRGAAETYHNLALALRQLGEWREAEEAASQALRHAAIVGLSVSVALARMGKAEIHIELGQFTLASKELEQAGRLTAECGDELGDAEIGRIRGLMALRRRDYAKALEEARGARDVARQCRSLLLSVESGAIAALALKRLGRQMEAESGWAEVLEGFGQLGAVALAERFMKDWES